MIATPEKSAWRPAASVLRDLLNDPHETIVCPGVYDGLTARIALRAGFNCLYMVSLVSFTHRHKVRFGVCMAMNALSIRLVLNSLRWLSIFEDLEIPRYPSK